jgi:SnoaL-like domain
LAIFDPVAKVTGIARSALIRVPASRVTNTFTRRDTKLEEDRDVEPLVEIHTEDCEVSYVSVPQALEGNEGLRESWSEYCKTFGEVKSTFRNVFVTEDRAALEWTTEATSDGDQVSYDGVSILEIEGGTVRRLMAYFAPRELTRQVVD